MVLMQDFIASKGQPIQREGLTLYWTYWIPARSEDEFYLRFLKAAEYPTQGVGVIGENCRLEVAGKTAKEIGLWVDTASEIVRIRVVKPREGARVGFFNQWRDEKYGTTLARLNDAAMQVVEENGVITLRCSDGVGDLDFGDLIFEVRRKPARTHQDSSIHS